ncbi:hypothetical protein KFK09_017207 [Dendrobium nobile]|uniref:cellulose synthase (UDP-forming) n=1 Tax=Dendrobium nobile TaxID=94219 RepID=A0A8T3B1P0_DENNO|nr:hypothetical protein KFK09_017207 [Dendrobium nobile]
MSQKRLEKRFGQSPIFIASTFMEQGGIPASTNPSSLLQEAIHVISCGYEDKTEWGKRLIGWIYGSVTEDILQDSKCMLAGGYRSIACHRVQLSKVLLQSIFPTVLTKCFDGPWDQLRYCSAGIVPFDKQLCWHVVLLLFVSIFATGILELKWSGVGIEDWWRNEQFWVIGGTSAHLFAVFQGLLKVLAGIDTNFTVTSKASDEDGSTRSTEQNTHDSHCLVDPTCINLFTVVGAYRSLHFPGAEAAAAGQDIVRDYRLEAVSTVRLVPFAMLSYILICRYDREGEPSQLVPIDVFVSTVDPLKEPPLITANTVLSILAVDYPVDKVSCYVSDDGSAMLTFEALSETAEFAKKWVPFCKKHNIEPRAPEFYFSQKIDYLKDKIQPSFVKERRAMKREYEEFKVRINALVAKAQKTPEEGWTMQDGTPWPGNNPRDHPGMIQVFLGHSGGLDVDGNELPRLVYVSREKRPGFQHHKKAGAMNALIRVSAVLTNGAYLLNVDCDHYFNNSKALREAMCFMMDPALGKKTCYVQFPQRFDGIDIHDRYANRNIVFFDINLKGLDGIQGPVYVGTGCCFNRQALYGYDPVLTEADLEPNIIIKSCCGSRKKGNGMNKSYIDKKRAFKRTESTVPIFNTEDIEEGVEGYEEERSLLMSQKRLEKRFGQSPIFIASTFMEQGGIPASTNPSSLLQEAIHVISCGYEDKTEWGKEIGWIYGSVTEDILTGFKMHARGWISIYCMPPRPAFKGSAPINLSDRLNQVLRWALGSIEILLSRHCPIWYGYRGRLKLLERIAYINTIVYPITSIPLIAYCVLPAICLLTGKFIIPEISNYAGMWFILLFVSIFATGILELKWSGVGIEDWWRNEQFWVIGGTSAHLFAVFQGLLKVLAGIDTNFTVTSKASDEDGEFFELYVFKWTSLLIPPTTVLVINMVGIVAGVSYAINSGYQSWGPLFGKLFFSFWVIVHLYPFLKGLLGRQNRTPTIVIVWSILLASIFSLLWVRIDPFTSPAQKAAAAGQCGINC